MSRVLAKEGFSLRGGETIECETREKSWSPHSLDESFISHLLDALWNHLHLLLLWW